MVTRAGWVHMVQIRGISDTPHIWFYEVARTITYRSRRIRVWITLSETGHVVSRLRSLSLEGVPVKRKLVDGQDETPLERVITCGHELRVPEAFSPQALDHADVGAATTTLPTSRMYRDSMRGCSQLSSFRKGCIAGGGVAIKLLPPGDETLLLGYC